MGIFYVARPSRRGFCTNRFESEFCSDAQKRGAQSVTTQLVRDEGVAGSNPATPTNQINDLLRWGFRKISYGDSYGDRNPLGFVVRSHSNVAWAPRLSRSRLPIS
jgi:hypothetical protein